MIREAIRFILDSAINPNLNNVNVINNPNIRAKINSAKQFIMNAKKIGDLYSYIMKSIERPGNYDEMLNLNLIAFEDIIVEFRNRFQYYLNDNLRIDDFIVGDKYNSYDICFVSKHYNFQSGIYFVKNNNATIAALIKVTLDGNGRYPNEWYNGKENEELKYFMQSRNDTFNENYVVNSTIINTPDLPIFVFIEVVMKYG